MNTLNNKIKTFEPLSYISYINLNFIFSDMIITIISISQYFRRCIFSQNRILQFLLHFKYE